MQASLDSTIMTPVAFGLFLLWTEIYYFFNVCCEKWKNFNSTGLNKARLGLFTKHLQGRSVNTGWRQTFHNISQHLLSSLCWCYYQLQPPANLVDGQ